MDLDQQVRIQQIGAADPVGMKIYGMLLGSALMDPAIGASIVPWLKDRGLQALAVCPGCQLPDFTHTDDCVVYGLMARTVGIMRPTMVAAADEARTIVREEFPAAFARQHSRKKKR